MSRQPQAWWTWKPCCPRAEPTTLVRFTEAGILALLTPYGAKPPGREGGGCACWAVIPILEGKLCFWYLMGMAGQGQDRGGSQAPGEPLRTHLGLPKTEGRWGGGGGPPRQEGAGDTGCSADGTIPSCGPMTLRKQRSQHPVLTWVFLSLPCSRYVTWSVTVVAAGFQTRD